jgi:hypothetical protein
LYDAEDDDLNRVVFLNADGTQTAYIFDFPVKYVDEKGAIKDITLDIADSNKLGQFETASGSSVTTFSRNATDGIRLVGNDTVISLVPHIPVTRLGAELSSSSKITASSTAKRIDNKTVSYDYDSKTTIEYSLTYTGFKEDIVVNEKAEEPKKATVKKPAKKKAEKTLSPKNSKQLGDESDEPAVAKPSKKKTSSKKKEKVLIAETGEHDDDLPPIESEDDAIISTIDVDEIAREVERTEGKAYNVDDIEDASVVEPTGVVAEAVEAEAPAAE